MRRRHVFGAKPQSAISSGLGNDWASPTKGHAGGQRGLFPGCENRREVLFYPKKERLTVRPKRLFEKISHLCKHHRDRWALGFKAGPTAGLVTAVVVP